MTKTLTGTAIAVALAAMSGTALARDQIQIVGSSTVFPYSQAVAEQYAGRAGGQAPIVESLGTGGGFKAFCQGVGEAHPDITGASRAIKDSEKQLCAQNGVTDVTEVLLGYDGLSMAVSRQNQTDWNLTEEQIFRALAAQLPDENGNMVANPNKMWSDVDPSLPNQPITVFGPPPTSGTRDAFVELVMLDGCEKIEAMAKMEGDAKEEACSRMRTDGPFVEAGENDNLIVQRLNSDPNAMGIFGYSFLYENQDTLKPVKVNGVEPTFETIASGEYPVARPLYVYIKNAHLDVIPGLKDFVTEYVSDQALGPDGYLAERGLTPLEEAGLKEVQKAVSERKKLDMPSS